MSDLSLGFVDRILKETYGDAVRVQLGLPPVFDRAAYGYSGPYTFDNQLWAANRARARHEVPVKTISMRIPVTDEILGIARRFRPTPWPRIVTSTRVEALHQRAVTARRQAATARSRFRGALDVLRHGRSDGDYDW